MTGEKRFGMGPIPEAPEQYLTERQVNGMPILRMFGWKLVCIRRPSLNDITAIFRNSQEGSIGILGADGILRISDSLQIRKKRSSKTRTAEKARLSFETI
jgi:hypothetical protein